MTDTISSDKTKSGTGSSKTEEPLQSRVIMPTARTLYLLVACGALATVALGLSAALIFQIGIIRSANLEPVPSAYHSTGANMPLDVIGEHLQAVRAARGEPARKESMPPDQEMWTYRSDRVVFTGGKVTYIGS